MINTFPCTPDEARSAIIEAIALGLVPMLWGPQGVGKTSAVRAAGEALDLPIVDVRLIARSGADLGGIPAYDHDRHRMTYYVPDFWPDPARDGERGILLLGELAGIEPEKVPLLNALLLERQIGSYQVPEGWHLVCDGNRTEDDPGCHELSPPVNDRLVHLLVQPSLEAWVPWAIANGVDAAVLAYLQACPHHFLPDMADRQANNAITPSPRSWVAAARVAGRRIAPAIRDILLAGILGEAVEAPFSPTSNEAAVLPPIDTILGASDARLPTLIPRTLNGLYALGYALTGALVAGDAARAAAILRVVNAIDTLPLASHGDLPLAEVQACALSLVADRAFALGLDIADDPAFLALDRKREADATAEAA